ncbi:MAG TPA: AAA family ATPase, partial [Myxococcaceae bacterium]|nr:AAA family ATPase [Myxococcaceae bacterium]
DKGVSALVAFGLPPFGTEDTAPRAIRASLQLQDALGAEGIRHAMGIASGRAYCGIIGAASRREYTLIGGVVNRAARLMQLAVEDIWCDGSTVEQAGDGVECEALPPVRLKGFAEPVPVFRPRTGHRQVVEPVAGQLFGHAAERERILEAFATLGEGEGGLLVMEAEAGMGKSVLARYALEEARARGFRTLHSEPDTLQRMMPYAVWTGIFRSLLGLSETDGLTAVSQRLFALPLRPLEWHAQRLPLLNPVLPTPMPETDFTRQLHPDVRAVNARAFLVEIFRLCTRSEPVVLVLEDAHWFDSASWALLRALADEGGPILILLSHRPFQGAPPEDYDALVSDGRAVVVRLGALAVEETGALLAARLGGAAPPLALVRRIWAWSQGNPFFAEELLHSLQERGVVRVRAGQCVVDDEVVDLPSIDLPATIEGVITSRIDRLPPEEQLTIKVASVIGRAFLLRLLCDIFPGEQRAASLRASVEALVAQGFVKVDAVTPEPTYSFKHVITREVAYGLMLYEQRQRLHRAVASRLEESHEDELRPWLAVLAHHWRHAGVAEKAVHYLSRAGE